MYFRIALILCFSCSYICAQTTDKKGSRNYKGIDFGIGTGLDYGGIGGRLTVIPIRFLGIFCSGGYTLAGFGYNTGINIIYKSERRTIPYMTGMYGYNAGVKVKGNIEFRHLYLGPTFGMGLKKLLKESNNSMNFELLIPIRNQEFHDKVDELNRTGAKHNFVPPFAVSFGFHIGPPKKE